MQIYSTWTLNANCVMSNLHYFDRYYNDNTEMWFFGVGLGDQSLFQQCGISFLRLCEEIGDPCLGRIMVSCGETETALLPWKGDFNVWWAWGHGPDWLQRYFDVVTVKPDLIVCPSKTIQTMIEKTGVPNIVLPFGVDSAIFKPLRLKREGLGFSGTPNHKSPGQMHVVLDPVKNRPDFDFRIKTVDDPFLSLRALNEWYNKKKCVFGMISEDGYNLNVLSGRIYEAMASATPLVMSRHEQAVKEALEFNYPYQTSSFEETECLVDYIFANFGKVQKEFEEYSVLARKKHCFVERLKTLFAALKELGK